MSTAPLNPAIVCIHCLSRPMGRVPFCLPCWLDGEVTPEEYLGGWDLPAEPTTAWPGTTRKVEVLAERFAAGACLWHPDDVQVRMGVDVSPDDMVAMLAAERERRLQKTEHVVQAVLAILATATKPLGPLHLALQLDCKRSSAKRALRRLCRCGRVVYEGNGYRLAEAVPVDVPA